MRKDSYPLGYTMSVVNFMSHRTAETHAAFFLPTLERGWRVARVGGREQPQPRREVGRQLSLRGACVV
jgi:hypothetical protein